MTSLTPFAQTQRSRYIKAALFNVADAINNVLLPHLSGGPQTRGQECVAILARISQLIVDNDAADLVPASDPNPAQWAELVAADLSLFEANEIAVNAFRDRIIGHQVTGRRAISRDKLQAYLRSHELGGSEVNVTDAVPLAGGRSKLTTLVSQTGAKSLPTHFVVRQDWATAVTGTSVVSEYALLARVWQAGLKVPKPLILEPAAEALGAPFMIVTRLLGSGKGDIFNPPVSAPLALQLAAQLAKLHTLPVDDFARLNVPMEAFSQSQLQSGLAQFKASIAKLGDPVTSIVIAMAWMEENYHRVSGEKALVHNDLGCHNFLIGDDDLIAILDWEIAHIGNPAADLGYVRGWVEKMVPWDEFLRTYQSAGGPEVSPFTLDFYTLWCGVRLYCLLLQARAGVAAGAVKDTEITYACAHFMPQLITRLTKQLKAVID